MARERDNYSFPNLFSDERLVLRSVHGAGFGRKLILQVLVRTQQVILELFCLTGPPLELRMLLFHSAKNDNFRFTTICFV